MTNFKTFLAILFAVAVLVFVAIMIAPKDNNKEIADASQLLDMTQAESDIDSMAEVPAETNVVSENVAEATTEETADDATILLNTGNGLEEVTIEDSNLDAEIAYADVITAEEIESLKDFLATQPDVDGQVVKSFWQRYGGENGYFVVYQDDNGNYAVPASDEMFYQTDLVRPKKVVEMGLSKTQMDDAFAFPFNLTEEQVKKILAAKLGSKIDFSEDEISAQRIELFQFLFASPHALEGYFNLLSKQKIADEFVVTDYWQLGNEFLERCKEARKNGEGMNIWYVTYRNQEDKEILTTSEEYHKYVIGLWNLLWPKQAQAVVYTAKAGNHYHLVDTMDFNSMRAATPADYDESLASLMFPIYTKTGKIALMFGANYRDKRPEILNYTVVKKPVVRQKAVTPVPTVITPPIIFGVTTTTTTTPPPSGDTPGNPPPDNPPPGGNTEHKSPAEGTKAQTGGGQKSDPGPGEQKPDQGNGNGQYQQGTSENPDGSDQKQYDPGPEADNTDNGKAPETEPIETHTSVTENGPSGGNGGGAGGDNSKEIAPPPAED